MPANMMFSYANAAEYAAQLQYIKEAYMLYLLRDPGFMGGANAELEPIDAIDEVIEAMRKIDAGSPVA